MLTISHSRVINRPILEVFDAAADPHAQLVWDSQDLESVEILTPGPLAKGSRVRCRFKALGAVEYEFAEYDRPHRFMWYSSIPRWENWHSFDFEVTPDGTRITQESTFKLKHVWNLAAPLIRRLVRQRLSTMAAAIENYLNTYENRADA